MTQIVTRKPGSAPKSHATLSSRQIALHQGLSRKPSLISATLRLFCMQLRDICKLKVAVEQHRSQVRSGHVKVAGIAQAIGAPMNLSELRWFFWWLGHLRNAMF